MPTPTVQPSPDSNGIVWDSQPAQPATQSGSDTSGIVWDKQPIQPAQTSQPSVPQSDELHSNPSDSLLNKAGKTVGGLFEGIGEGVFGTASGASDLLDKATGMQPGAVNKELRTLAGDDHTSHGLPQTAGRGIEDVAEFLLGDEALKALPLSQRLIKSAKVAQIIEDSPLLNRVFQAGIRAVRGGAVGTIQGEVKSGGNTSDALASGAAGAVGSAILPEAIDAVKAAPRAVSAISDAIRGAEPVVQPELQGAIRKVLSDVAAEHGISIPDGTAMRDTAEHVGQAIKAKGSELYKSIDEALEGTRFQSFDEQLSNVRKALRNDTGVDHDMTGRLIERLNDLEDAKAAAQQTAIDKGIDPKAFDQANAYWRQGSAIQDLSSKLRQSTSGLPENLKDGSKAASAASGEVISPNKLAPKVQALRDSGRLTQALGAQSRADDLVRYLESAKTRTAEIAANRKTIGKVAVGTAAAAGAGGLAGEAIKHVIQ
jgi:hypothetical protein